MVEFARVFLLITVIASAGAMRPALAEPAPESWLGGCLAGVVSWLGPKRGVASVEQGVWVEKDHMLLDLARFNRLKESYLSLPDRAFETVPVPVEAEALLAYQEARAEKLGNGAGALENFLAKATPAARKQLARQLRAARLETPQTLDGLAERSSEIYRLLHESVSRREGWPALKEKLRGPGWKQLIRRRMERAVLVADLTEAYRRAGLIRDATMLERFNQVRKKVSPIETLVVNSTLNSIAMTILQVPVRFTEWDLMSGVTFPAEAVQLLRRGDWDGFEQIFRAKYAGRAKLDVALVHARRLYSKAFLALGAYYLAKSLPDYERKLLTPEHDDIDLGKLEDVVKEGIRSWFGEAGSRP